MNYEKTAAMFEEALSRQEQARATLAFQFDDETDEEFAAKVARRIRLACATFANHRNHIDGIDAICPGLDAIWRGFKIQRRRVDQLDNVYVFRA